LTGAVGFAPRPHTLRVLWWMAAGAWDRTAAGMFASLAAFGGKPPPPWKLNPFRRRVKTAAEKEAEKAEGWLILRTGLKAIAGGR
jgi:hypothetical protein